MNREQWARRLDDIKSPLGSLLAAYFNEDWDLDHGGDWRNVVATFARDHRAEDNAPPVELDELLADDLSEEDFDWLLLWGLHASLKSDRFGYPTWRAWLEAVRDELGGAG